MSETQQGYITHAVTKDEHRSAYALAMSIKLADPARPVCLAVDSFKSVPSKYEYVYDYIVELPFGLMTDGKKSNVWQLYYCSPFEETFYIDSQTLMLSDPEMLWMPAENKDMLFCTNTENFRYETNIKDNLFLLHRQNKIQEFWTDVFYFRKSAESSDFFKMFDVCTQNWRDVYKKVLTQKRPEYFDQNIIINTALHMCGVNPLTISFGDISLYTYINLDALYINERSEYPDEWYKSIPIWVKSVSTMKIGNFKQTGVLVYEYSEVLTDEMINDLKHNFKTTTRKAQL